MTQDILITYGVLAIAVTLFVTDKLRTDIVAIIVMLLLAWTGILSIDETFSGFSSNAVMAIIGVMILGYGVDRSGLMVSLADMISEKAGSEEKQILVTVSGTVGVISAFMQNIGAAALFLPALRRISKKAGISPSRLIMPMGFAAILGGTLTMVASGPLIVLNDLLGDAGHTGYHLFSVTPIGLALLLGGIGLFYFFGNTILPDRKQNDEDPGFIDLQEHYDLPQDLIEVTVPQGHKMIGKSIEELDLWKSYSLHIIALEKDGSKTYVPWRKTIFQEGQTLALLGENHQVQSFLEAYELNSHSEIQVFSDLENESFAGFAEIIIPPRSSVIGKTLKEIALRKNYKVEPLAYIHSKGDRTDLLDEPMYAGLEMVVFGRWQDLRKMKSSRDFILITEVKSGDHPSKNTKKRALFCVATAFALVVLGFSLPLSFLTGAILIILSKVVPVNEIYDAVGWKTVFLLAGLIPLGIAFEKTGAAELTAKVLISFVGELGHFPIILMIALLGTIFSLFMSNVAATVLLVPLVLIIGENFGIDPRGLALLVALSTDNSFLLPTHPVNAFTMAPGNYRTIDYIKAGGLMTLLFLVILIGMMYLLFF